MHLRRLLGASVSRGACSAPGKDRPPADYKSAIQQAKSLRYACEEVAQISQLFCDLQYNFYSEGPVGPFVMRTSDTTKRIMSHNTIAKTPLTKQPPSGRKPEYKPSFQFGTRQDKRSTTTRQEGESATSILKAEPCQKIIGFSTASAGPI